MNMADNEGFYPNDRTSRRRFLKVLAASAALPSAMPLVLSGCGAGAAPEAIGDIAAGNLANLSVGTLKVVGSEPVCIGRDADGVYAMTLTCTHEGCNIATSGTVSANGIACDCHGSRFDAQGNVLRGPAREALQHFSVSMDAQMNLTIHGGSDVSAATRLAV
jgi:nitrite reductase/ring-hydroxylating ferredoxin subunit